VKKGAKAVIFDVTDSPGAAKEVRIKLDPINRCEFHYNTIVQQTDDGQPAVIRMRK
jgi:hypothetical protein